MRFLADESCDFSVVRAVRAAGHDVLAASAVSPRAQDADVMKLAVRKGRFYDLCYSRETCNITAYAPGPCPCCQKALEFDEMLAPDPWNRLRAAQ